MNNVVTRLLDEFINIKKSEYKDLEERLAFLADSFLPKNSKVLTTNFLKKIYTTTDGMILILLGHLYLERILNEIIDNTIPNKDKLVLKRLDTFYKKVTFLKSESILSEDLSSDLLILNKLRNCFAHELNFKLSDFDLSQLSDLRRFDIEKITPKQLKTKEIFSRIIIRIYILYLLSELLREFKFLHLLDLDDKKK